MSVLMRRLVVLVTLAACKGQTSVGPVASPAQITTCPADGSDDLARSSSDTASAADGNALLRQGLASKARGDVLGARKLFDRARIALERAARQTVTLEPRSGLWEASAIGWVGADTLAVAAGADVHFFRGQDRSEFLRLRTNANRVVALAVSADSRTMVSAGAERDPEVWDLVSGKRVGTLARTEAMSGYSVSSLAFSPDGQRVAGRTWENAAPTLWNTATLNAAALDTAYHDREFGGIRESSDEALWPEMLAFSPDGTKLATVQNNAVILWDLRAESPKVFLAFRVPNSRRREESLTSVIFQPNGPGIAAGSESGRILIWNSLALAQPRFVQAAHENVLLAYSHDGAKLLSASSEGDLRTLDTKTLSTLVSKKYRANTFSAVVPSSDSSRVAVAADGGLAVVYMVSGNTTEVFPKPVAFTSLTSSPDAHHVALGTATGALLILSLRDGSYSWLRAHSDSVTSLAFSPDGTRLASVSSDHTARIWDVAKRAILLRLDHAQPLNSVAFRPDGRALTTAGEHGLLSTWDATSGRLVGSFARLPCDLLGVAYSPDGTVLAASGSDYSVHQWSAHDTMGPSPGHGTMACTGEIQGPSNSLAFSADGQTLAAPISEGIALWSVPLGKPRTEVRVSGGMHVRSLAISPQESVVTVAVGSSVRRWRFSDRAELPALEPRDSAPIDAISFVDKGRWLLGAGQHGNLSVWSMATGKLALTIYWEEDGTAFAIAPSGRAESLSGSEHSAAVCRLGVYVFPPELCEERYRVSGLVKRIFAAGSDIGDDRRD